MPQRNDSSVAREIYNMLHQRNLIPKLIKIVQKENQPNCATAFIYFHEQTADLIVPSRYIFEDSRRYIGRIIRVNVEFEKQKYSSNHTEGKIHNTDIILQWVFENGSKNYETIHLVNSFNNVVQQTSNNSNAQQQINTEPDNVQQTNTNKRQRSKSASPFDNKVFS